MASSFQSMINDAVKTAVVPITEQIQTLDKQIITPNLRSMVHKEVTTALSGIPAEVQTTSQNTRVAIGQIQALREDMEIKFKDKIKIYESKEENLLLNERSKKFEGLLMTQQKIISELISKIRDI